MIKSEGCFVDMAEISIQGSISLIVARVVLAMADRLATTEVELHLISLDGGLKTQKCWGTRAVVVPDAFFVAFGPDVRSIHCERTSLPLLGK